MSDKHCGPDIVKYFVVEPTGNGGATTGSTGNFFVCSGTTFLSTISGCTNGVDFNGNTFYNNSDVFFNGVITACTGIHTSNIYGCSPITVHDELILLNKLTLSAVTQDDTLTQILGRDSSTGEVKYRSVESIITGATSQDTFVTGSTLSGSTLLLSRNDGVELTTDLSSILFTGNTSGDCITDLYITNLYGCSPITVNDTLNLTNNARLNINATTSFTLAVESYDNNIATFRDVDGEDIFFAQGSLANQDLVFGFGDFGDAYGYAGYTLDTVLNQHNFTNGNLYLGNVSTFNTDTKLYVDGNTKVTGSLSATTFYGDGSNLTGISTDNFFVSGGTYNSGTDDINFVGNSTETTFDVDLSSLVSSVSGDTFVVSGNANAATSQLTFTNNSGGTFNVTNSAALFSDNDINVTGGTYNPSNGCITFGTNSGTTFDVCGFVTGFTDSYTTDAYLSGTEVRFDNSVEGSNYYNVDLNPLLSGKTDNTTFNTYTANTQTILDGKIDSANNVGGTNEFFKDKSGTTLNFRTLSGGSNTTVSTVGDVVKVDVTIPTDTNTFVTGFTYNDANTFTISRNDGVDLSTSINTMTGLTVNGSISATTYFGDGSNLTGISTDDNFVTGGTLNSGTLTLERQNGTVIITGFTADLDTYVTGGTVSISATDSDNSGTIGLFYKNSDGIPRTLPFKDTFVTGGTYDNGSSTIEFTKNDSTTFNVDLSSIDVNDTFSTGGTVTQSATSGSTDVTIQITGNQGFTPYNITGLTDTFVNDFSYSAQTFTITQNDGSTFETEVESVDLANILSGVTFDIATSGSISATTFNGGTFNGTFVGDGSGLTGITDNDTFVTGTTFSSNQAILSRNDGFEVFKFSGGSNVNLSNPSTNEIKIDVSLPSTMNTFTTGFTYNNANTFTITDNDSGVFNASINTVTGLTVNGTLSATTYFGDGSNLTGISSEDNFVTGGTFSSETLTLNRQNGTVTITGFTSTPNLNDGEIFVGNTGNTAQSVAMTGDVNIDNTGLTTIQPDVVTYDKMQDVTQKAILGSENVSGGTVTEIPVVDQFLSTGVVTVLLSDTANWDINGNYTGSTISGTFQSQMYYDGNYFFIAVLDNVWIRLIRG